MVSTSMQDIRQAFRRLRKSGFATVVAIGIMALGIGSSTAIFSIVDVLLLRSLPYQDPDRLVLLWGNTIHDGNIERRGASYPDFQDWQQSTSFEGMAAFSLEDWNMTTAAESQIVSGERVSANYFSLLGIKPILGRSFNPVEDQPSNGEHVVLLGYGLWQRRFGSDPAIVGKIIKLVDHPFVVIGVLPAGFRGLTDEADIWTSTASADPDMVANRGMRTFPVVARLKKGISIQQAQTEMKIVAQQLERAYPATNYQRGIEVIGLKENTVRDLRTSVLFSFGAVLLVLLISCVNVSNLMLLRAEGREREIAVRYALGATRMNMIRLALIENAMLAMGALVLGVWVAYWAAPSVLLLSPIPLPSYAHVGLNGVVIAFSALMAGLSAILVSFLPVLRFWNRDLNSMLTSRTTGAGPSPRLRSALVVSEITLAMVLLIGAGLLIRTFQRLISLDPGFKTSDVLTVHFRFPSNGGSDQAFENRTSELLRRVQAVPGVADASLSSDVPLDGRSVASYYAPEGKILEAGQIRLRAFVHRVTPNFFSTFGIRLTKGRWFTATDRASLAQVILISEDVVQRSWPSDNPIGKRIQLGRADSAPWFLVIGVVDNVKYRGLPANPSPDPDIYLPLKESTDELALAIRSTQQPTTLLRPVSAAIKGLESEAALYDIATMQERAGSQLVVQRFAGVVMGLFACIAFLLAIVGIYSVMSSLVSQRTKEIGIRMALGAPPAQVFATVVGRGLVLGVAGTVIGILCAMAMRKLISSLLFGVSAVSPLVFGSVAGLMLACVVIACYLPARSATKVDPVMALRQD